MKKDQRECYGKSESDELESRDPSGFTEEDDSNSRDDLSYQISQSGAGKRVDD